MYLCDPNQRKESEQKNQQNNGKEQIDWVLRLIDFYVNTEVWMSIL